MVRLSFNLGVAMTKSALQRKYDPMVTSARVVSTANSRKRKSELTDEQFDKVAKFIDDRPNGVSILQRAKDASAQLLTGTFRPLKNTRVDIGEDAIRTRHREWRKHK